MVGEQLLEAVSRQERDLTFATFDADSALTLGNLLVAEAKRGALPIVIDIGLFHRRLFFAAMPGSVPDNADWARKKRNVVERFHRSSYAIGLTMKAKASSLEERYGLPKADFAEHGGGFPITLDGCGVVGCIAVSGLPQQEDHMLIVRALCQSLGRNVSVYEISDILASTKSHPD